MNVIEKSASYHEPMMGVSVSISDPSIIRS
jgi:hypothetical protein